MGLSLTSVPLRWPEMGTCVLDGEVGDGDVGPCWQERGVEVGARRTTCTAASWASRVAGDGEVGGAGRRKRVRVPCVSHHNFIQVVLAWHFFIIVLLLPSISSTLLDDDISV